MTIYSKLLSEKVKLPKEVCDLLDKAKYYYCEETIIYKAFRDEFDEEFKQISTVPSQIIMRALVLGYEPELSAEELTKEVYFLPYEPEATPETMEEAFKEGVRIALDIHGIHYDWMDDAE